MDSLQVRTPAIQAGDSREDSEGLVAHCCPPSAVFLGFPKRKFGASVKQLNVCKQICHFYLNVRNKVVWSISCLLNPRLLGCLPWTSSCPAPCYTLGGHTHSRSGSLPPPAGWSTQRNHWSKGSDRLREGPGNWHCCEIHISVPFPRLLSYARQTISASSTC